jgi:hypothetical protein
MMHLLEWLGGILLWLYAERIKRFCRGTLTVAWRLATLHRTRFYLHYAIWIGACKVVNAWTEQGLIKRQPTARWYYCRLKAWGARLDARYEKLIGPLPRQQIASPPSS